MSKCDFWIEFERANRTYLAGEIVRGKLTIEVNQDVECRDLKLTGLWRTHGRGNQAKGEYYNTSLYQGQLKQGERRQFDFEFQIPRLPITYHGTLINVDHYVSARVDIPWAFDAKGEADFIVLPGDSPQGVAAPLATFAPKTSKIGVFIGSGIGIALLVIGFFFIPAFGIGLVIMAIGAGILFFTFRNILAERKLGPVECVLAPTHQVPGGELGIRVSMTPKKSATISKIKATITGHEIAVSGSGTNKTTHRHQLHSETFVIDSNLSLSPGVTHTSEHFFPCPDTQAYSFSLGENRIEWAIMVHVEIARWPDWVQTLYITVIPPVANSDASVYEGETLETAPAIPVAPAATDFGSQHQMSGETPIYEPAEIDASSEMIYDDPQPARDIPLASAVPQATPLAALIAVGASLRAADRYGDEREKTVAQHKAFLYEVELVVERSVPTFGVYDAAAYRSGMTLIGKLANSDIPIAAQFPDSQNEEIRQYASGDTWSGIGSIHRWDDLYDRLELRVS